MVSMNELSDLYHAGSLLDPGSMAKIGKRQARRQLVKDEREDSDGDEVMDSAEEDTATKDIPIERRVISKPVSRLNKRDVEDNPFKGFKMPQKGSDTVQSVPVSSDTLLKPSTLETELTPKQKEALINLKNLNKAFLKAVEDANKLDYFIDLSGLFQQYTQHRKRIDDAFNYARALHTEPQKPIYLGFQPSDHASSADTGKKDADVRPVSVDLPAFAVKPIPPTPVLMQDTPVPSEQHPPFTFPSNPGFTFMNSNTSNTKQASQFSFSSQSADMSGPLTFQQPSQTIPSPVSQPKSKPDFSFPSVASLPAFGTSTSSKPLFSFNTAAPDTFDASSSMNKPSNSKDENEESGDEIPAGQEQSFQNIRTNTELLKRGKGEEEEEELFQPLRSKLFLFDTLSSAWTDLGIGFVKVNRQKDSGKARILCRAEGSGRVLLNAYLDPQIGNVSHDSGKRDLTLTCFNQDSRLSKYLIRTKEADSATQLYTLLQSLLN